MKTETQQNDLLEMDDLIILRINKVSSYTGLSRSMIYDLVARREFPHPISLGQRAVGWIKAEVVAWLEERIGITRHR